MNILSLFCWLILCGAHTHAQTHTHTQKKHDPVKRKGSFQDLACSAPNRKAEKSIKEHHRSITCSVSNDTSQTPRSRTKLSIFGLMTGSESAMSGQFPGMTCRSQGPPSLLHPARQLNPAQDIGNCLLLDACSRNTDGLHDRIAKVPWLCVVRVFRT